MKISVTLMSFVFLGSCVSSDPFNLGLVKPLSQDAPGAPALIVGNHLPTELQGSWISHRKNDDVDVWARMTISDDAKLTMQLWSLAYPIGHYVEVVSDAQRHENVDSLFFDVTLTMQDIQQNGTSFMTQYQVGSQRICRFFVKPKSQPPEMTRLCRGTKDAYAEPAFPNNAIYYKER